MPIQTEEDAIFIVEKIRDGTLTGERKEKAFSGLQDFRSASQNKQPTREHRIARISELEGEQAALKNNKESALGAVIKGTASDLRGLPEAAAQFVSGGASTAAGGAAALPVMAFDAVANLFDKGSGDAVGAGKAVVESIQEAGTFEPRTDVGQRANESVSAPLESLEKGADFVGDKTLDVTGSPEAATAVKTAILGAPALFGVRRGGTIKTPAKTRTPRQEVARVGAEEGFVTPPSVRGEAGVGGLAEGLGGKLKTKQQAIEVNQGVANNLASRAVGLPDGVPVTIDVLQGIRTQASQAYEAVRNSGKIFTDTTFRRDLSASTSRFRNAAKDFPELAKSEIIDVVNGLRVAEFDAGAGIDAISLLRNKADVAFRSGDKSLGNAYKSSANAIENVMERHLGRGSNFDLVNGFRQARQQIAETYSVQEALQGRITGEVSATQLAAQLKKGVPLTGDLRLIADFANTFPSVSKLFTGTAQAFSPLDLAVGGGSLGAAGTMASFGAGPAALIPLVGTVARPLLRKAALSDSVRRSGVTNAKVRPSGSAIAGAIASSAKPREGQ